MIYIKDNFLDKRLFELLSPTLNEFTKVEMPGKNFWVKEPDENFVKYVTAKLSIIENKKIENILCFFREAKQDQDNTWRIHNDSIINEQQPDRAIVLYMSENKSPLLNGTAFWEHENYGHTYIESDSKEFDRMLVEDANDKSKWKLGTVIGHRNNRLLSYPCDYFHSKYPKEYKNQRVVLVMFYKTIV